MKRPPHDAGTAHRLARHLAADPLATAAPAQRQRPRTRLQEDPAGPPRHAGQETGPLAAGRAAVPAHAVFLRHDRAPWRAQYALPARPGGRLPGARQHAGGRTPAGTRHRRIDRAPVQYGAGRRPGPAIDAAVAGQRVVAARHGRAVETGLGPGMAGHLAGRQSHAAVGTCARTHARQSGRPAGLMAQHHHDRLVFGPGLVFSAVRAGGQPAAAGPGRHAAHPGRYGPAPVAQPVPTGQPAGPALAGGPVSHVYGHVLRHGHGRLCPCLGRGHARLEQLDAARPAGARAQCRQPGGRAVASLPAAGASAAVDAAGHGDAAPPVAPRRGRRGPARSQPQALFGGAARWPVARPHRHGDSAPRIDPADTRP